MRNQVRVVFDAVKINHCVFSFLKKAPTKEYDGDYAVRQTPQRYIE